MRQILIGCISGMIGGTLIGAQIIAPAEAQAEKPTRIQAPFHIIGSAGQVLAEFDETNYGGIVELAANNGQWLRMGGGPDGMTFAMAGQGGDRFQASVGEKQSRLVLSRAGTSVEIRIDSSGAPLIVLHKDGEERVSLGGTPGGNTALSINNNRGQMAVQIGADGETGAGKVVTANAQGDVTAYLSSATAGGEGEIGIRIGGATVGVLHANQNKSGGMLTIGTTGGGVAFKAGVGTDNKGGACADTSKGTACLSALRMFP